MLHFWENLHFGTVDYLALPAVFLEDDGSKVAYIVADRERLGVYVARDVP